SSQIVVRAVNRFKVFQTILFGACNGRVLRLALCVPFLVAVRRKRICRSAALQLIILPLQSGPSRSSSPVRISFADTPSLGEITVLDPDGYGAVTITKGHQHHQRWCRRGRRAGVRDSARKVNVGRRARNRQGRPRTPLVLWNAAAIPCRASF